MRRGRTDQTVRIAALACVLAAGGAWACGGPTPADAATGAPAAKTSAAPGGSAAATPAATGAGQTPAAPAAGATLTGFAFVDSSVTGMGSRAALPAGATVYPFGTTIKGTTGCRTNRYGTDGLIVAVIDYQGRPTSGSLTVTSHPASGGEFKRAPYYLDLNPGRTLQFLGPIVDNGTYDLDFSYDYALGHGKSASGTFVLARACPPVG
jgi:hypothetical protein